MAYSRDEEERKKRAAARKQSAAGYAEKRESLLAQNKKNGGVTSAPKSATTSYSPAKTAVTRSNPAEYAAGTRLHPNEKSSSSAKASQIVSTAKSAGLTTSTGYQKKNFGDNDMAVAQYGKQQQTFDLASMTYEQAMGVAVRIVDDKERDSFLKAARKQFSNERNENYVENLPTLDEMRAQLNAQKPGGVYQDFGKKYSKGMQEQFARDYKNIKNMKVLGGLHDVNGNAINANTADFATIVQGIRSIADSDKRNAAIAGLKELIKTEGSRFYGQTIDEKLLKSYLGSPDFTQDDYDDIVGEYVNAFYPQDGYDEENAATYWGFYDEIETSGYSDDIKRQLRDKLDSSFKNSTGKDIPARTESVEETAAEDEAQEEEEPGLLKKVGGAVGGFVDGIVDSITRPYTEKPEEEQPESTPRTLPSWMQMQQGEEPPAPPSGWLKNDGMPDMSSATRLASAGRSDSTPPIPQDEAEVYGPQQRFTTKLYIKDDADVVGAILKGRYGDLDKADTQTVDGFMQYKTVKQIIGTVVDPNAVAEVKANNRGAENVVRENYGMLGQTASMALEVLMGEEYPAELRNDGLLILMELGAKAERLAQNGMLGGDPELPLLERLLTTDPDALNELNAIYSARDELEKSRAELLEAEDLETQKKLAEAREAVLKGEYSDEQLAMVQKYAPELTGAEMSVDKRRMELGGLFDDWSNGFFATEYVQGDGGYIRFQDTAVYRNLASNGVIDDTDYRVALNTQMHNVIDEDTRHAMSLGLTLTEYYKRIGGMNEEGICQRAATRIAQQGGMITEEDMQNIAEYGDGVNALEWSSATVGKATVGLFADYADSLYVGMSEANVVRTAGRMQVEYQDEFGDLMGRYYYRRDLERLLDSGTLPEGMAVSLRRAMAESIDIYQVGIDPEALGGLRTSGSKARAIVKQLDRFMQENATEGQFKWYQRGASMVKNAEQALIAMGVGKVTGAVLGSYATTQRGLAMAGKIAGHTGFTAGYDIPGWNAYYEDAVINKHLPGRSAASIASFKTGINHATNYVTYSKIAGQAAKLVGLDSLVKGATADVLQSNAAAAFKAFADTHAFVKGVVTFIANEADEVVDEFKEGMGESYIDNAIVPLFQKVENGEKITASDVIKAVLVIPSADVVGNLVETAKNLPEIVITSSLFAFAGAAGEGVSTYKSTKIASDILNGKGGDIGAFVEAAQQDLQDDQFCAALDEVAQQSREDESVAVEMMTDDGADGLADREREANEQADAHAEKKEAAAAGMQAAQETMSAVQEKVDNGTADDTDVQMLTDAQEAYVKDKTSFEEAEREELQKREEAKRLRTEKYRNAKTAAKTRLAQQDADIAANMVATMEQRKAQTEAAQLEQERSNVLALEAQNFVEERYADETPERKQELADQYVAAMQGNADEDFRAVDAAVRQFQKKFKNIVFKIVDKLDGEEGKYDLDSNELVIARDMTYGEIANRVITHELTHAAEKGGKAYERLKGSLLKLRYGEDLNQIESDIISKQNRYNDHYANKKIIDKQAGEVKTLTREGAIQEIVAEINSELLSGNEDMIKRLVSDSPSIARRVWETVKDFLQKVGVMKDTEIDKIRRVEKMFEKALKKAGADISNNGGESRNNGEKFSLRYNDDEYATPTNDDPDSYDYYDPEIITGEYDGAISRQEYAVMKDIITRNAKEYMEMRNFKDGAVKALDVTLDGDQTKIIAVKGTPYRYEVIGVFAFDPQNYTGRIQDLISAFEKGLQYYEPRRIHRWTEYLAETHGGEFFREYDRQSGGFNPILPQGATGKDAEPDLGSREQGGLDRGYGTETGRGNVKFSLPTGDNLRAEMQAYHALQTQTEPEAEQTKEIPRQPHRPMGERQFTTKTLQESQAVPQWIKDTLYNNPNARFYEKDTNDEQIVRSMNRLQEEGYEAMRDRVLSGNADSADNVADANLILAMANRDGDVQTFLDVAARYAAEGTETAKTLQARKIFSRMTPTGMRVWAAGQMENKLSDFISRHQPMRRQADARAKKVADSIKDKQGGDELLRLQAESEYTITDENNRWGVPINQKQQALIDHYKLNKVARPGDAYNRATLKQRMLEAILAEPNPENVTGQGLNLIQRLEYAMEGAPVIFNSDLDYMGRQMALYAHSPVDDQDGRVGDLALARLYEAYGNITPATGKEKRRTWRYTATLLSLPSAGRNVIGNAAQGGVNAASHGVAQALDSLISLGTGKRTVAGLSVKERVDGWYAFAEETKNTIRDFYVDKAITSHGEDRHNLNQRGRVYQNNTLEALRLTEGFLMSVGDRNFWKKAYVNSLAEQQRVAEMNGEEFDYEAACERAEAEANYATFNEDSRVRDLLNRLKNPPEDASDFDHLLATVIDYLMPFTGVPTNVTKRMIQYSPAGLGMAMLKHGARLAHKEGFNQYEFVTEMSRGLTGTALFAIGGALLEAGLISLGTGEEEDKKIYGAETAQGRQYTPYIRIGDQYISLSTFMPAGSALIMGATARDIFKDDEDVWNAIKSACFSSFDMIFDASYMSALAEVFGGYGSLGENTVNSLMNSTISMNVPAVLGQIASALDPYVRNTKDKNVFMQALKSGLIAKIPGLRNELLEAKVDITGEKVANTKQYVAPIDPLTRTYANDDETLQYLIDFARETGDSSVIPELFIKSNKYEVNITKTQAKSLRINRGKDENGKAGYQAMDIQVTDEEKWALNEEYGKAVFAEIRTLMSKTGWKRWDDKERAEEIKKVIKETKLDVLENFVKKRGIE